MESNSLRAVYLDAVRTLAKTEWRSPSSGLAASIRTEQHQATQDGWCSSERGKMHCGPSRKRLPRTRLRRDRTRGVSASAAGLRMMRFHRSATSRAARRTTKAGSRVRAPAGFAGPPATPCCTIAGVNLRSSIAPNVGTRCEPGRRIVTAARERVAFTSGMSSRKRLTSARHHSSNNSGGTSIMVERRRRYEGSFCESNADPMPRWNAVKLIAVCCGGSGSGCSFCWTTTEGSAPPT